jgi:copper(I)-binding protein
MKHLVLLMLSLMVVVPLAACSEESSDAQNSETQVSEQVTEQVTEQTAEEAAMATDTALETETLTDAPATAAEDVVSAETDATVSDEEAATTDVPSSEEAVSSDESFDQAPPAEDLPDDSAALKVMRPYALQTAEGQANGAVFLQIENSGTAADKLVAASTPIAGRVELHTHEMAGATVAMKKIDAIDLPAGETVVLEPSGMHIMLFDLTGPLMPGTVFALNLEFENSGTQETMVLVSPMVQTPAAE